MNPFLFMALALGGVPMGPRRRPDSPLIRAALAAWGRCPYAVVGGPVREAW